MNYDEYKELETRQQLSAWGELSEQERQYALDAIAKEQGGHAELPEFYEGILEEEAMKLQHPGKTAGVLAELTREHLGDLVDGLYPKPSEPAEDVVNSPTHYNRKGVECIDAIEASMEPGEFRAYLKGNIIKYMWRCNYKGKTVQDLEKAKWYLSRLIERQKEAGDE